MKICVAGASGFVGKALIQKILETTPHNVIALSRSEKQSEHEGRVVWRQCDLFSMLDIENAIEGADVAIYLVHSMLPSAHLVQGTFEDFDLVLADNFARACQKKGIKQIIYLGGIIPQKKVLSAHLRSRLEVEKVLASYGAKTTCLRAGLILGKGGSSFRIMYNLVKRLPFMLCPSWTSTLSAPVALGDVVSAITHCVSNPMAENKVYDLGEEPFVAYKGLMKQLSKLLGFKRFMLSVPFVSTTVSRLWVMLITGAPKNLVYPLIQSLSSTMLPRADHRLVIPNLKWKTPKEALESNLEECEEEPHAFKRVSRMTDHDVRSVQRIVPVAPVSAKEMAQEYFRWLPWFYKPFINVLVNGDRVEFCVALIKKPLLILEYSEPRSTEDRQLFYIKGGLLAKEEGRGRLEFRNFLNRSVTVAAIHEFRPRLPWFIYKYTQALLHLFTMNEFRKHFLRLQRKHSH